MKAGPEKNTPSETNADPRSRLRLNWRFRTRDRGVAASR